MARLYKIDANHKAEMIASEIEYAESLWERGRGLLGRKHISESSVMWIKPCNNIHTFFMRFSIDCIFVNKDSRIVKIVSKIKPFRIVGPYWKSQSVIEAHSGFSEKWKLQEGDQLYVVS